MDMDEFGYLTTEDGQASLSSERGKDSLRLRPLMLSSITAQSPYAPVQHLNLPQSRSVPNRLAARLGSPGHRAFLRPPPCAESDVESSSGSEIEMRNDRRAVISTHDVVFDCISPQDCLSGQELSPSSPALSRSRSQTFRFPLPPSSHRALRRRRTATALWVPASARTASFRADAEAFINSVSPPLPLATYAFSPMDWSNSLDKIGKQGWSPGSSRAVSPELKITEKLGQAHVLSVDAGAPDSPDRCSLGERSMPPSYQQANQLPKYCGDNCSPSGFLPNCEAVSEDESVYNADAQKLARLHASFHLLDNERELTLSSSASEPTFALDQVLGLSVEEQMAFLCGMGYRYRKSSSSLVPSLEDNEEESEFDGEQAEIGSNWSSSHDSEETRVEHSPAPRQGLERRWPTSRSGVDCDMRLPSNATSARSSPILSGELSARKMQFSISKDCDVQSLDDDGDGDSMPSTPRDACSPLAPNQIDVRRLCAQPLAFNTPSPRFDSSGKKDEVVTGSPLIMREFSYLVDDTLTWDSIRSPVAPQEAERPATATHMCDDPFDAPLTTPELALDGIDIDPMEALPSPLPVGLRPIVRVDSTPTPATKIVKLEPPPLPSLARSSTCPAGFEQEGSTMFEMVPQFHRPFAAIASTAVTQSDPSIPPLSRSTLKLAGPAMPASASTSVLSRPRPLARQANSSFFGATDLQATQMSLAKARRMAPRHPYVPARNSSLDLKGEFDKAHSENSEARSYFSSDSESEGEDDEGGTGLRRNSDPVTSAHARSRRHHGHVANKSASFPNPHSMMGSTKAASIHRRNAARHLSSEDLEKAVNMSVRHRDLLAATSLAAAAAQTRRGRRRAGGPGASASCSGSEESEPEQQGTYHLSSSAVRPSNASVAAVGIHSAVLARTLPTLFVARTDAQRRSGITGLAETEPARIREVERYVTAKRQGREANVKNPAKLSSRSSRVRALFGGLSGRNEDQRSVARLNTPRKGVLIVEEKWVEVI